MIELWSAQQHSWLSALGHEVLVRGALPETQAVAPMAPPSSTRTAERAAPRPSPAAVRAQRPAMPDRREAAAVAVAQPRQTPARMPDRLHFALIRASGCNPNAPEAAQMIAQWPQADELRGNPAAKRALWPRLRGLRKQALP